MRGQREKDFSKKKHLRVFDPRNDEDFLFGPTKEGMTISSLKEGLLVILIPPNHTILSSKNNPLREMMFKELAGAVGIGFVCAYAVPESVMSFLPPPSSALGDSTLSYFPASPESFSKYGKSLERLEFGEVTIGCCDEKLEDSAEKQPATCYDDLYVLARAKRLRWFISFYADTGSAYVVTRISEDIDRLLSRVRKTFKGSEPF